MARARSILKNVMFFGTLLAVFILAEAPTAAGVIGIYEAIRRNMPELSGGTVVALTYVIAVVLTILIGRLFFGQGAIKLFRSEGEKPQDEEKWAARNRKAWVQRLMQYGEGPAFVLASFVGGSGLVAWYYVRQGDPNVGAKAWLAAVILGLFSPAWCIAMRLPEYRAFGVCAILAVVAAGVVYPLIARARQARKVHT